LGKSIQKVNLHLAAILPHKKILESICDPLKIIESAVRRRLNECETWNSPGKKVHSSHPVIT
jgi:hypothetical protein